MRFHEDSTAVLIQEIKNEKQKVLKPFRFQDF